MAALLVFLALHLHAHWDPQVASGHAFSIQ
jgi:hypothetical protein